MVKNQSHAADPLYKGNAERVIKMVVDLPVASIRMVTMAIQIVTAGKQIFRFTAELKLEDEINSKFILKRNLKR
jgi:hypothetical protein